jgi:hypothetical protein
MRLQGVALAMQRPAIALQVLWSSGEAMQAIASDSIQLLS